MEINADYVIRRTILFDNKCGFVLGENPKAPNPYVTWQFNEQDGHRDYFWGHYHNEPDMAERDLHNRAEDYQRRYYVQEVANFLKDWADTPPIHSSATARQMMCFLFIVIVGLSG